jgi:hypothetical protein
MIDATSTNRRPFANTDEFYIALGLFFAAWSRSELAIDCAIWKARGTETEEEAHERSARMTFSDKCTQLRTLIDGGKFGHADKVKILLEQIEHHSGRNVFAHSFLASDQDSVSFIYRPRPHGKSRKYEPTLYKATPEQFIKHVQNFVQLSFDFEQAAGLSDREVRAFAARAIPLATPDGL